MVDVRLPVAEQVARSSMAFHAVCQASSESRRPPRSRIRPRTGDLARSIRRSSAPRRSCSRPSPTSKPTCAGSTPASATACTACRRRRPAGGRRRPGGRARRVRRAVRACRDDGAAARAAPAGDHVLVPDSVYGPTRRFCDKLAAPASASRSATTIRRSARASRAVAAEHARGLRRVAGVGDLRGAGRARDRPAANAHGAWVVMDNTWATPLGFRPFDTASTCRSMRHQVPRRPFGRADRRRRLQRREPALHRLARPRHRRRPTTAFAACAGCARWRPARAARAARCGSRRGCGAARGARGRVPGAARRTRPRPVEARLRRRRRAVRVVLSRSRRRASRRCSTGCACSAWARAGAASRAWSCRLSGAGRGPCRWVAGGRSCGCTSGSRSRTTWSPTSGRSRPAARQASRRPRRPEVDRLHPWIGADGGGRPLAMIRPRSSTITRSA